MEKQLKINSFLIAFIISLVNFVSVLVYYTNINIVLVNILLIFFTVFVSLMNNKAVLNKQVVILVFLLIAFAGFNFLFTKADASFVFSDFAKLMIYGISALIVSNHEFDIAYFRKSWLFLSLVQLAILHSLFNAVIVRSFSCMDAGFILNYVFVGFTMMFLNSRKKVYMIGILYILLLSVFFGHRGSILVNVILLIYLLFKSKLLRVRYLMFLIPIILVFLYMILQNISFLEIYDYIASQFSFLNSYSLRKIIGDLESGTLNLSGREVHYGTSWNIIKKNHYLIPGGFGMFRFETGLIFPHNIFLDLYITFGALSIIFLMFFIKVIVDVYKSATNEFQVIYACIFIYSIVRLLTGGTFVTEASFWVLIGIGIKRSFFYRQQKVSL